MLYSGIVPLARAMIDYGERVRVVEIRVADSPQARQVGFIDVASQDHEATWDLQIRPGWKDAMCPHWRNLMAGFAEGRCDVASMASNTVGRRKIREHLDGCKECLVLDLMSR